MHSLNGAHVCFRKNRLGNLIGLFLVQPSRVELLVWKFPAFSVCIGLVSISFRGTVLLLAFNYLYGFSSGCLCLIKCINFLSTCFGMEIPTWATILIAFP